MKKIIMVLVIIILCIFIIQPVFALETEDIFIKEVTDPAVLAHYKEYANVRVQDSKTEKCYITSFDVKENGDIVVSYNSYGFMGRRLFINVFNNGGEFLYGFEYYHKSGAYAAWVDGYAATVCELTGVIKVYDENCNMIKAYIDESGYVLRNSLREVKNVGNDVYTMTLMNGVKRRFEGQYTSIVKTTADGTEIAVIDESLVLKKSFTSADLNALFPIIFVPTVALTMITGAVILPAIRRRKERNTDKNND